MFGARVLAERIMATGADTALAGAGVANLATWLGVQQARAAGSGCVLCAELGLWEYEPTLADPFVFNHRAFPSATMLADSSEILGMVMAGPGTRSIACLGAAIIDATGAIDSTVIPGKTFLVGSGGGNDVASTADEATTAAASWPKFTTLTEAAARSRRCLYVTSPGARTSSHLVTDLGVFAEGVGGRFVPGRGPGRRRDRRRRAHRSTVRGTCGGWNHNGDVRRRSPGAAGHADGRGDRRPPPLGPPRLLPAGVADPTTLGR